MGVCNIMFAFLTALVAVNFIFAEESSFLAPGDEYASDEKPPSKETANSKKNESTHTIFNNCSNYCLNCRQALLCKADHRAAILTCHGRHRHCVEGKCASNRSKECANEFYIP